MFIEIVSPEKTLYTGDVTSVHLPGSEGSFQILNNHAPIVSTLKNGQIKLKGNFDSKSENLNILSGSEASLEIQSGVVEMKNSEWCGGAENSTMINSSSAFKMATLVGLPDGAYGTELFVDDGLP